MNLKKLTLLVTTGLLFFLVMNIVISTLVASNNLRREKNILVFESVFSPDKMVTSFNYLEVKEEVKEEELVEEAVEPIAQNVEQKQENVKEPENVIEESQPQTSEAVYVGKMTSYGADCRGCSGIGALSCKTENGSVHTLSQNGQYYTDHEYGSVRIVAADLSKFPCGTIVEVNNEHLGVFNAVVMDTGASVKNAWANGTVWMDLAFETESDPQVYAATSNNTTYTVKRIGW